MPGDNCHGWSATNLKIDLELGTCILLTKLTPGDNCHGWSPTIPQRVTRQPNDGHSPTQGWSATNPRMVTHQSKDGHSPTCLPLFTTFKPHLRLFYLVWPFLNLFGKCLALFGPVWPNLTQFNAVKPHSILYRTYACAIFKRYE